MSVQTLTDEVYLTVASTSNQEAQMEPENTINEDELLAVSEDENSATSQVKVQTYNRHENVPWNRKRRYITKIAEDIQEKMAREECA